MLRMLTGPVRQLADLRSPRPCDELTEARSCQRRLERQATRLPGHSDQSSAVHHLTRLTCDIIRELAGDQPARDWTTTSA